MRDRFLTGIIGDINLRKSLQSEILFETTDIGLSPARYSFVKHPKTQTMSKLSLETSLTIKASADKVWKGITDPETVKQYFFGTLQESDWQVGSPIRWKGEWDGRKYEDKGNILDITPGKYLKYTYWSSMGGTEDKPENYNVVTYTLTEKGDETLLEITQDNLKDEAAKKHSEENWHFLFGGLKKILEN